MDGALRGLFSFWHTEDYVECIHLMWYFHGGWHGQKSTCWSNVLLRRSALSKSQSGREGPSSSQVIQVRLNGAVSCIGDLVYSKCVSVNRLSKTSIRKLESTETTPFLFIDFHPYALYSYYIYIYRFIHPIYLDLFILLSFKFKLIFFLIFFFGKIALDRPPGRLSRPP